MWENTKKKNTLDITLTHLCLVETIFFSWSEWADPTVSWLILFWNSEKVKSAHWHAPRIIVHDSSSHNTMQLRGSLTKAQQALFQFNNEVLHIWSWLLSDHRRVGLGNFTDFSKFNDSVCFGPATPALAGCLPLLSFFLYFIASSQPPSLISPLHLSQTRTPAQPSGRF